MLALQALSQFAALVYSPRSPTDVTVTLSGRGLSGRGRSFVVNSSNRLLQQTETQVTLPTSVRYSLSGTGCALIQVGAPASVEVPGARTRVWGLSPLKRQAASLAPPPNNTNLAPPNFRDMNINVSITQAKVSNLAPPPTFKCSLDPHWGLCPRTQWPRVKCGPADRTCGPAIG